MRIEVKPLSVNASLKGKKYHTDKYKSYIKLCLYSLKPMEIPEGQLRIDYVFGFSSRGSDLTNPLKLFEDILQKKYGFNDNKVYETNLKKEIVPKGKEFIEFKITSIKKD